MNRHQCPRCGQERLMQTGVYWFCVACDYAITHAALLFDRAESLVGNRSHADGPGL